MQRVDELTRRFGLPGVLAFDEDRGLVRLRITSQTAKATFYLQGAHCVDWQPAGAEPVLFLSRKSEVGPGKAIRGGIPIAFPWFANDRKQDRIDGHPGPLHGFARIQDWALEAATHHGRNVTLLFTLGPTAMSRSMGYDNFLLTLEAVVGMALEYKLTVKNTGATPLSYEEAFHSYYHEVDVQEATVSGLEATSYIDKTDNFKVKPPAGQPIHFTGKVDRVYLNTTASCIIHDGVQHRNICIEKTNSHNTVVFNPYSALPDLGEWEWHEMVAVETANVGDNGPTLSPGASATMGMRVTVVPQQSR